MKKVLLCIKRSASDAYKGGVVTIIDDYINHKKEFLNYDIDVKLFAHKNKKDFRISKLNNIIYGVSQKNALINKLKNGKIDIVNIHTSREFLFLKDVLLAKAISKKSSAKVVLTIHVGDVKTVFNRIDFLKSFCVKIINRYISKTVFLSKTIRRQFVDLGVDNANTEVLYNFHCLNEIEPLKKNGKTLELLFVGAIHKEKGIIELLKALNNLKEQPFHISVCGKLTDLSIKEEFETLVENLDDKITICGYVSGEEKSKIFDLADILILPSYHEGFPLVILEALASGTAIISTKVGATPEILNDKNAFWVDVADVQQIEKSIVEFLNKPETLKKMKRNNFEKGKEFSIDEHIQKLCEIYNDIL
ncbi:MAG: glycosyltransferase family 4 protein [Ruminococcaceae bacterium]|nr:glycosyltransferase family 4 protein [Oscillospiraceae bacterium]